MNVHLKLCLFREYHNMAAEDVATKLSLNLDEYNDLEKGKTILKLHTAQQLSELYRAPVEFFLIDCFNNHYHADVIFTNCSFAGNGANGYINHQYSDRGIDEIVMSKNSEINTLKQQLATYELQNNRLLELVTSQLKSSQT